MPRKNRSQSLNKKPTPSKPESNKTRYRTRQAAERAIAEIHRYQPDLKLSIYQSPDDGGWYLTSR